MCTFQNSHKIDFKMSSKPDSPSSDKDSFEVVDAEVKEMTQEMENIDIGGDEFSLVVLADQFNRCLKNPKLTLVDYIAGYKDVYKFLVLLGRVFSWVGSDVYAKIETLEKYLEEENKDHYQTIQSMIDYEVENDLIEGKSGSGTLLSLHRALEYIIVFLLKLEDIQDDDNCSVISREAYEETLKKYHPWLVQKAAKLAMGLLPTKKGLIAKVCQDGDEAALKKSQEDFSKAVSAMRSVYEATQVFYKDNNLLEIP